MKKSSFFLAVTADDTYCGVTTDDGTWSEADYCANGFILGTNAHQAEGTRYLGGETAVITDQYVYDLSGCDVYRFAY